MASLQAPSLVGCWYPVSATAQRASLVLFLSKHPLELEQESQSLNNGLFLCLSVFAALYLP